MLSDGLNQFWPTPIYKTSISTGFCDEMLGMMLQNISFEEYANGKRNLLNVKSHTVTAFKQIVYDKFSEYFDQVVNKKLSDFEPTFKAWVTSKIGSYSMQHHNHSSAPFVSVFYIFAQEEDVGGEIVFNDPRVNANRGYLHEFQDEFAQVKFKPTTGDVVIFPGYLYHSVNPFMSDMRIAVPVDMFFDGREDV